MSVVAQTRFVRHNAKPPLRWSATGAVTETIGRGANGRSGPDSPCSLTKPLRPSSRRFVIMPQTICPKCDGPKTVAQGHCQSCNRARARAWRAVPENRERKRLREAARRATKEVREAAHAKYMELMAIPGNREKLRLERAAHRAANREKLRLAARKRYARPAEKERRKEYDARNRKRALARAQLPENKAKRRTKENAYYQTPIGSLRKRLSVAIRNSLKGSGKPATWPSLVGYTVADLRQHIERQFVRGMDWHNMAEWHIDHIVPLASFQFSGVDDPEFKAAWAMTNLRPLWGSENIRKQDKREHLL